MIISFQDNFLIINETSNSIECTTDASQCNGGYPDGYGCPPIYCEPALNPFGECECNNQVRTCRVGKF